MNLKQEILSHLPNPREICLPDYLNKTITEEKINSGLSIDDIEKGIQKLSTFYRNLRIGIPDPPDYSEIEVYIAYIDNYLRMYYPRMTFVINNLLRYTQFYEVLKNWSGRTIKILDIGAGPGTMFIALIEYLEYINQIQTFDFHYDINVIEEEENFTSFLENLINNWKKLDSRISERISLNTPIKTYSLDFDNLEETIVPLVKNEKYDVIILSFIINENDPNNERTKELFRILSNYIEENGIIIFIGAASDYIHEYFEIDFKKEMGLNRVAPSLNGNAIYDSKSRNNYPFFKPCGDLCTFQIIPTERHSFCYLILSRRDLNKQNYVDLIQDSINFYNKYRHLVLLLRAKRDREMEKINEYINILGIFSDRRNNNYYICNGACKFKVIDETGTIDIREGDLILFKNVKFDGTYQKINMFKGNWIRKPYAEIGIRFQNDSKFEAIPYLLSP